MQEKNLPETYKGYSTKELLQMYETISEGGLKGKSEGKIEAMDDFLREYKIAPVFQQG